MASVEPWTFQLKMSNFKTIDDALVNIAHITFVTALRAKTDGFNRAIPEAGLEYSIHFVGKSSIAINQADYPRERALETILAAS